MTEEQRADMIRALLLEREGVSRRGLAERVKAIEIGCACHWCVPMPRSRAVRQSMM